MISAYVMPHPPAAVEAVGYRDLEGMRCTLDAYRKASLMIQADAPETIVIISPHAPMYYDGFYIADGEGGRGDLSQFGAPDAALSFLYDTELRDSICKLCEEEGVPYGLGRDDNDHADHGTMVPLLFITEAYDDFRLVRISPTYLDSAVLLKMGSIIERAAAFVGRKITILASADLSHRLKEDGPYGYVEDGPLFDKKITDAMRKFDVQAICDLMDDHAFLDRAGQCGTPSVTIMAGALYQNYKVLPDFLSYEGPFGVGYAICAYKCEDYCVKLARKVLERYIQNDEILSTEAADFHTSNMAVTVEDTAKDLLPVWMQKDKAGVFVCLKKHGELRGCIGTFLPTTDCVANEICRLAIEAGTEDPRFMPVTMRELHDLSYTVDILSAPEPCEIDDLDVKRYGVIVRNGYRRGLLLPNLEGVDTIEYQLSVALSKAGIRPEEGFEVERFTVERHT